MSGTSFMFADVLSVPSLLLVDSAVKGTALLILAAVAVFILKRDSAATRHLVWLLAIIAILVVPVVSAGLPQWRVLPAWATIPPTIEAAAANPTSTTKPALGVEDVEWNSVPDNVESPAVVGSQSATVLPNPRPTSVVPEVIPASASWNWNWFQVLPLVWAIGFCALILRLLAARWMLWFTERQATALWSSRQAAKAAHDPIVTALGAASAQLGIRRPVTLLMHSDKTIPIVWGILRCRLLLPVAARDWSGEQLRSVLLHELAHIKRRDPLAQLVTQIACALYWFNPLVWFAAWRLGVERERACDDLVLASGVRPSAYAGHLLDIVTELSPTRWTQSCGLAMARKTSLEGRLVAVLNKNLNRRRVSVVVAAISLVISVGIALPLAMLRAAEEKPAAPVQQPAQKPKVAPKLEPGMEEKLKWGETVNGLRAALVIRPTSSEAKAGDMPDLYLAVQNVSKARVRFCDADVAANVDLRTLYLKIKGEIKMGLGARVPALGDLMLQPREVTLLPMFLRDAKNPDERSVGVLMVGDALKAPNEILYAKLQIDKAPAGAWTGKLVTGETNAATAAGTLQPKDKKAQVLFNKWQMYARKHGAIPGGLVSRLGDKVKEFIKNNTGDNSGDPYAKKMLPLVPRFDLTRDRTPAEVVALLDDVAAAHTIPLETTLEEFGMRTFKTGTPLPPELSGAPWGEALPNGLRTAWLLEPSAKQYRLGTPLKSHILIHNAGQDTIVFRSRTWHQSGAHKARDVNDVEIKVDSTYWTTLARLMPYRLAPGEFVELNAAGIGVGANKDNEDWQGTRVGSWIDAKEGDVVTFMPDEVPLSDWNETPPPEGQPGWWLAFITERLGRELPLPASAEERTHLLNRATRELFGTAPTAEETEAFTNDNSPDALDSLAQRLVSRPGITSYTGPLQSGTRKFRVLPVDPDAATRPRTASNPGRYTLGNLIRLAVSGRPDGTRIVNEASIEFFSADPKTEPPGKPVKVKLPDGYNTWAAAWHRGGTVLWVQQKTGIHSYDFTNPAQVKETDFEGPEDLKKVPKPILDALHTELNAMNNPKQPPATSK